MNTLQVHRGYAWRPRRHHPRQCSRRRPQEAVQAALQIRQRLPESVSVLPDQIRGPKRCVSSGTEWLIMVGWFYVSLNFWACSFCPILLGQVKIGQSWHGKWLMSKLVELSNWRQQNLHSLKNHNGHPVQGWAKEWYLGCVNTVSWLPLATRREFTQPGEHSFAQPCRVEIWVIEVAVNSNL